MDLRVVSWPGRLRPIGLLVLLAVLMFCPRSARAQDTGAEDPEPDQPAGTAKSGTTSRTTPAPKARSGRAAPRSNRAAAEPADDTTKADTPATDEAAPAPATGPVHKTDAQWRAQLTKMEYWVTRQKGTEPAFSGKYAHGKFKGVFTCVGCGAELFNATTKFESGTGWPSFYQPTRPDAVKTAQDLTGFEPRVEVECARCEAHLGHVFDDGPAPTGLRYCMNSVALRLKPLPKPDAKPAEAAPKSGGSRPGRAGAAAKGAKTPAKGKPTAPPDPTDDDVSPSEPAR